MDDDPAEGDAGFFPDFAPDRFFDRFGGFDEAGEGGVPVWWPVFLTAEEDVGAGGGEDGHDDGGVGAGEGEVGDAVAGGAGEAGGWLGGWGGGTWIGTGTGIRGGC